MAAVSYTRIKKIGIGGQGEIWEVQRKADGERFALKYMNANPLSPDPAQDLERFAREIRCQTSLKHSNIVEVIGANTTVNPPWFVMRLAEGNLRERIQAGPIPEAEVVTIFRQLLSARNHAHSEGVYHRDLKPENILKINGVWAVGDFGLSRRVLSGSMTLTATNQGMGSLHYAAPEQWLDAHEVDERADVFALGKILWELLTAKTPWPTVDTTLVPGKYRWLIHQATEQAPEKRYPSSSALSGEFELLTAATGGLAVPLEQAKTLLAEIVAGDVPAVAKLDQLLVGNQDDEILYKDFVPYLPRQVLEKLNAHRPDGLRAVAERFTKLAAGGHPWTYVDTIADFLKDVFFVTDELSLKHDVMERILVVGSHHNRFHVGEVFASIASKAVDPPEVLMIAQIIRSNPMDAKFFVYYLKQYSLAPHIMAAIEAVP